MKAYNNLVAAKGRLEMTCITWMPACAGMTNNAQRLVPVFRQGISFLMAC